MLTEIRLFADDCILYRTVKSSADCVVLQSDISKLQSWACACSPYARHLCLFILIFIPDFLMMLFRLSVSCNPLITIDKH